MFMPNCIICHKQIHYWPNCSSNTAEDYNNIAWVISGKGKFKSKEYFHKTCFKNYVKEVNKKEEKNG